MILSIYALKPGFQNLLRPLVQRLAPWGVTPNQVTIFSGAASLLVGSALAWAALVNRSNPDGARVWLLLPAFLPVRMALNAIDGMLAREFRMETRAGAILNETLDLISDAALTLPFAILPMGNSAAVGFAAAAALLVEVAGFAGRGGRRNQGPFGKSDRAVALGVAGAWLGLRLPVAPWAAQWSPWVWILLCGVTALNRIRVHPRLAMRS